MKILLTGASGRIGTTTALHFLQHGHSVRAFDKIALPEELRGKVEMVFDDVADRLALLRAADGCDGIVHLAAFPNPIRDSQMLFNTNVSGTQFVLEAAEAQGIKRVALASSCCAYGVFFAIRPFDFQYLPVDEDHPTLPQDLYGLSKVFNEQAAAAATRRSGLTTICLRISTVVNFARETSGRWGMDRRLRFHHNHPSRDLWSYIDARDVARAFRLAMEQPVEGHHVLNCVAPDSLTPADVRDLVRRHFPSLSEHTEKLQPDSALFAHQRAREVLDFEAEYIWRKIPELADVTPQEWPA